MSFKKFLYYLIKKDGRSGQVVNGVVTYSGQPKPLPQTPQGWQDLQLLYERSIDKHGLVTLSSLPFEFPRNGARIIRDALYKGTIEEELFLLIQRRKLTLTLTEYNFLYEYIIKGELDLSKVEDSRDFVSVPIMEIGLSKLLKANEKTYYEFPLSDPVCVNLLMDGIELDEKGNYAVIPDLEIDNTLYGDSSWAPFSLLSIDSSRPGVGFFTQTLENTAGVSFADRLLSQNFFAKAADNNPTSTDVHITGKIVYHCTEQDAANGLKMRFLRSGQNVGNQNDYELFTDTPLVSGDTYSHDIDITIPLAAGERLYLEMILGNTGVDTKIKFDDESKLSVEYIYIGAPTYVKCYKIFDLFKKLCGRVFNDENVAVSDLLNQDEIKDILITCGDAIRGLDGATIKTSLDDFWRFVDCVLMAGQAITPDGLSFEIEDRIKYYTEADEVDLGFVTDLKFTPAVDIMANTYKFGHPKQDIEDVNGKYDPNGNNQFEGPITKVIKEYNMVSQYKTGPYEIETKRINLDGKTTTDDNSDNDVFAIAAVAQPPIAAEVGFSNALQSMFIGDATGLAIGQKIRITGSGLNDGVYDITGITSLLLFQAVTFAQTVQDETNQNITIEWLTGGYYTLSRPAYTTLEGVPHDSIFNLPFFTPKAMLLRHLRWISGINYGLGSKKIKFTSGKDNKNTELKTVLSGVTVDEDKDESFASVTPMFIPFYAAFKTEVPIDIPESLEANPNLSYKFTDEYGQDWRIFNRMAGFAPNDYTPQEFKGLLTPNNDINLLIR